MSQDTSTMYDDLVYQMSISLNPDSSPMPPLVEKKLNWITSFMYTKKTCLEDAAQAMDLLTTLGDDELLVDYFNLLTILKDKKGRRR